MRNVILISLLMFLCVVSSGYCLVWYSQSRALKNAVEANISRLNAKQPYLTYEALEASGFPTHIYVSLVKPHFKGRVDQLLQGLRDPSKPVDPALTAMPAWNEDVTLDGRITLGVSVMADVLSLSVSGNWQAVADIGNQSTPLNQLKNALSYQASGPISCVVQMHRTLAMLTMLWDFQSLAANPKDFLDRFRMIDCNHGGNVITNAATQQKLASNGPGRLYITSDDSPAGKQIRFYSKVADLEVMQAGDDLLTTYDHVLHSNFSPYYQPPTHYADYGKQNSEVDVMYNGPIEFSKSDLNPTLHAEMLKGDITNDLSTEHMHFLLDNTTAGDTRTARIALRSEDTMNEKFDKMMPTLLYRAIDKVLDKKIPMPPEIQAKFDAYKPDQLYAMLYPGLVSLHSLGTIVIAADASYVGKPDVIAGDITLKTFELSTTPYGITAAGAAKLAPGAPQTGTLSLVCAHCIAMVDDIAAYAKRVQPIVTYFAPDKAGVLNFSQAQIDAVKNFLTALALPADQPNLHFTVISDATGVTINGRKLPDVMALAAQYSPSAQAAPPPPH